MQGLVPVLLQYLVVLSIVQGLTEFLPISSSGHLILVPVFLGWPDQGLMIDVAVHLGTLLAVMIYFWRDVGMMLMGVVRTVTAPRDPGVRLLWQVVLATVPVVIAGYFVKTYAGDMLRSVLVIGWATFGFGLLLLFVDRLSMTVKRVEHMSFFDAFVIGAFQALALIPGTSRAGITITAARLLGFERSDAARFSMLLSIPTILAAGILIGLDIRALGDARFTMDVLIAIGLSFISALIAIAAMMAWVRRATFTPFIVYRLILGAFLLAVAYGVVPMP